ncbi:unnamed protein product [Trichogramma brassicae]|uniref:Uncharacterized protein n=1 Tax=Trichogramma brassicae TaxID=86971 RepID=A0A6H5IKC6_9HYME|nr:unnamed protein product [Trichogramma brassicae]
MEFFKSLSAIFLLVAGFYDSPAVQNSTATTTTAAPKAAVEHRVWTHPATEKLVVFDAADALTGKFFAHADCDGDERVKACQFYLYEDLRPRYECRIELSSAHEAGRVDEIAIANHADGRWAVVNWRDANGSSSVPGLAILDWSSCGLRRQPWRREATILKVLPFKRDAKFAVVLVDEEQCRDSYCVTIVGFDDNKSVASSSVAASTITPLYERRGNVSYEYLDFVLLEEDKITGRYAHFMLIEDFRERLEADEETPADAYDRLTERITILKSHAPDRIDGNYSAHVIFDYVHFPKETHRGHRRVAYSAAGTDGVVSMAVQMKARSHPGWIIHCQQYRVDDFRVIYSIDVPYEPRDMAIATTGNHRMLLTYAECVDQDCRGTRNVYHARGGGSDFEDVKFDKRECDSELSRAEGRIYRDEEEPDRRARMTRLQLASALLALFVVATNGQYRPRNITATRTIPHSFPGLTLGVSSISMKNGQLAYIVCDLTDHDAKCRVYLEDFRKRDAPTQKSCEVILAVDKSKPQSFVHDKFVVAPIFGKYVLVSWHEENPDESLWRLTTVRMSDCESMVTRDRRIEPLWAEAVAEVDDHIVVLADAREGVCRQVFCQVHLDVRGRVMKEPEPWFNVNPSDVQEVDIAPILPPYGAYGILLMEKIFDPVTATQFGRFSKLMGQQTPVKLKEYHDGKTKTPELAYSNANGFLSFCSGWNREFKCIQNDLYSRQLFPDVVIETEHEVSDYGVHSLPNGGFLLLLGRCPENPLCASDANEYELREFSVVGHQYGETRLPKANCNEYLYTPKSVFFENEERDYCAMTLCEPRVDNVAGAATFAVSFDI